MAALCAAVLVIGVVAVGPSLPARLSPGPLTEQATGREPSPQAAETRALPRAAATPVPTEDLPAPTPAAVATATVNAPSGLTPTPLAVPTPPPPVVAGARASAAPATTSISPTAVLDFAPGRASGLSWPNDRQGVAWFDTDGYHLAARTPGQFVAIDVLPSQPASNFEVAATFQKVGGPQGGGYGIVIADQSPSRLDGASQRGNFLVFEVGDKGEVGAWRRNDDQWIDLLGWTPSAAVRPGSGENTLRVRVASGEVTFTVNGTAIPLQTGPSATSGGIGLFLGGDANQALLTRLSVTPLD